MNQPSDASDKRHRIYFGLALVLFGCCGWAAHLAIVPYWSSHLDGVQSELIVNSGHDAEYNPQAIREVERILKLNVASSR